MSAKSLMGKDKAQCFTHLPDRSTIDTRLTHAPEATCICSKTNAHATLRVTDEKQLQLPDCMATSPTLLRQSPRTLTRTCLTLTPTATTTKADSHTVLLISYAS